jgi:phosphatidylglycerol:prolipoprotein diacylglycerol transferase
MEITIGIDPVIFELGAFEMRWYSLAIMVSIFVAVWFIQREFRRKGLDQTNYGNMAIIAIAGGIIGARVFHLLDRLDYYLDNPGKMLDFQSGGLAIYGAVVGGFIGVALGCWIYKVSFLKTIDAVAPGLVLAQAIGRFGCIINGDAWGAKTDSPFAFVYTNPDSFIPDRLLNQPTHPYPVYDMLMNFAIFGLLIWLRKRPNPLPDGALFAIFVGLYGLVRFFLTYVREENVWFWGLQQAQVIALIGMVLAAVSLVYLLRNGRERKALRLETA